VRLTALVLAAVIGAAGGDTARGQDFILSEEQFNAWVTNGQDAPITRIEAQLTLQLRGLTRTCDLSPEQVDKLRLAARGDIERFQARVTEIHDRLVGKSYKQDEINDLWQQIQPLQQELPKVLGPTSLFNRVMRRTLRESQRVDYDRAQAERNQYRYAAKVRLFVTAFDRAAPMTGAQREALLKLILTKTRRPLRFGQYDFYYVQFHAAAIDDVEFAKILDKAQLDALRRVLEQAGGFGQLLLREGMEPAPELDPAPEKAAEGAPTVETAEAKSS
jgi:hypothetical protein